MAIQSRVSKNQIIEMVQKRNAGVGISELAAEYGLANKTVSNYLYGFKKNPLEATPEARKKPGPKPGKKYAKKEKIDVASYLGHPQTAKPLVALIGDRAEITATLKELFS